MTRSVLVWLPLLVLGLVAGFLHALSRRDADLKRRRLLQIAWILALLVGTPLWIFAAVALRLL